MANSGSDIPGQIKVKDSFDEIFGVEIDGWCYGVTHFPGEIDPSLIHRVVKELAPVFCSAIEHNFVFDILDVSVRLSKAAKFLIHEKDVAFSILSQLPNPKTLSEDAQFVLAQVADKVEQEYGGALDRLYRKWNWENEEERRQRLLRKAA